MIDLTKIKICDTCKDPKMLMDFYFRGNRPCNECKKCKSKRSSINKYGHKTFKIKITDGFHDPVLRGGFFIAKRSYLNSCIILYSVRPDEFQVKTKHEGKVIPKEFYVGV